MMRSRRARLALAIAVLVSITFIILSARGSSTTARDTGSSVFGPFERLTSSVTKPIGNFFSSLTRIRSNEKTISDLQQKNAALQFDNRVLDGQSARGRQLQSLLKTAGIGQLTIVPAQVIAVGPSQGFAWSITLDAGSRDGVKTGQCVINGDGLVGRVSSVGRSTSTVLLAIDPSSSIGARAAKSSQIGIATGDGLAGLTFQLLDPMAPLKKGDSLLSFGSKNKQPFLPGIPLGTITDIKGATGSLTRIAIVQPFVDFSGLDVVGIVVAIPDRDPRDSLLPSSPKPAPTVTITISPTSGASSTPPSSARPTPSTPTPKPSKS